MIARVMMIRGTQPNFVQWESEYPTSLVFEWSKRGWMPNGLVFGCHLNTGQPNHLNIGQMDAILFFMYWSGIQIVGLVHRTYHIN